MSNLYVTQTVNGDLQPVKVNGESSALEIAQDEVKVKSLEIDGTGICREPTVSNQIATKRYVDDNAGGSVAINGVSDITISSPADNEVLAYDNSSSEWINQTHTEAGIQSVVADVSDTEIGYLDGVSSAIQTQINSKHATIDSSNRLDADLINDGTVSNTNFAKVSLIDYNWEVRIANFYATVTSNYLPLAGYVIERTSLTNYNEFCGLLAPYDGKLARMGFRSEIAQDGNLDIRLFAALDGTEIPNVQALRHTPAIDVADDTYVEIDLTSPTVGSNNLTKGNLYAIYLGTPSAPYDTNISLVFMWDVST